MGWAVSLTQQTQECQRLNILEHQLTGIVNALMNLTRQSGAVYDERSAAVQAYLAEHTDEEGVIDTAAFDFVNSAAFTADFDRRLSEVQRKEQQLNIEKTQVESEIKMLQTNYDDQEKLANKEADNMFGYYK